MLDKMVDQAVVDRERQEKEKLKKRMKKMEEVRETGLLNT